MTIVAHCAYILMCSTTLAQTPGVVGADSSSLVVQQVATITVLGDSGVVVERMYKDSLVYKVVLAGPYVSFIVPAGEVIAFNDLQSPTVGGLLADDAAVFLGDLELTPVPADIPDSTTLDQYRVTTSNALVEIRTSWVSAVDVRAPEVLQQRQVPQNQRSEYIRAVREEVRKRRRQ